MIKNLCSKGRGAMTEVTIVGSVDMGSRLSCCDGTVVTALTITIHAGMVKTAGRKRARRMTVTTVSRCWHVVF